LWDPNEWQTLAKSFNDVACMPNVGFKHKTLVKLEEIYVISYKRSWIFHMYWTLYYILHEVYLIIFLIKIKNSRILNIAYGWTKSTSSVLDYIQKLVNKSWCIWPKICTKYTNFLWLINLNNIFNQHIRQNLCWVF